MGAEWGYAKQWQPATVRCNAVHPTLPSTSCSEERNPPHKVHVARDAGGSLLVSWLADAETKTP